MILTNSRFPFFPQPAEGETVYSVFCRTAARSSIVANTLIRELTGQNHKTTLLSYFPGYLDKLAKSVPIGHPWNNSKFIASDHTSHSYFTYFNCSEERKHLLDRLSSADSSHSLILTMGLTCYRSCTGLTHPRFCPNCIKSDRESLGFAYFKREHQLPGVVVCWKHGVALSDGCSVCGTYPIKGWPFLMAGKCLCKNGISHHNLETIPTIKIKNLYWLAQQSAVMLNSSGTRFENIKTALRERAISNGFGRGANIDLRRLAEAIEDHFGQNVLDWLGLPVWSGSSVSGWLHRLLQCNESNPQIGHTINLLLVVGTLFESISAFENTFDPSERSINTLANDNIIIQTSKMEAITQDKNNNWTEQLSQMLMSGERDLWGMSRRLGISIYPMIQEILDSKWRIPLTLQKKK